MLVTLMVKVAMPLLMMAGSLATFSMAMAALPVTPSGRELNGGRVVVVVVVVVVVAVVAVVLEPSGG